MKIEQMIGLRVQELREELEPKGKVSQAELGKRLGAYLTKDWPRQSVSHAEAGNRAFTAVEILALARVLGVSVEDLLRPPAGAERVEFPSGESWAADEPRGSIGVDAQFPLYDRWVELNEAAAQLREAGALLKQVDRKQVAALNAVAQSWDTLRQLLTESVAKSTDR